MTVQVPLYLQTKGYSARQDRQYIDTPSFTMGSGEGVRSNGDLKVTTTGVGLGLSIAAGEGFVRNDNNAFGGLYKITNDGTVIVTAAAADGTNPRVDQVIARIYDPNEDATLTTAQATLEILRGSPAAGATLDNRSGVATLPNSAMLLADVLVPAGFSGPFVQTTNIRQRRNILNRGSVPDIGNLGIDYVRPVHFKPFRQVDFNVGAANNWSIEQCYGYFYLPRKITATGIRYTYNTTALATTGNNWNFAFYEPLGKFRIAQTGGVNLTEAVARYNVNAPFLGGPVTFDAGHYIVFVGFLAVSTGQFAYLGVDLSQTTATYLGPGAYAAGLYGYKSTGGTTAPTTLPTGFSDIGGISVIIPTGVGIPDFVFYA